MARTNTTPAAAVQAVNSVVGYQHNTISQIRSALGGRSVRRGGGGGGETYEYNQVNDAAADFLTNVTYDEDDTTTTHIEEYIGTGTHDKPLGQEVLVAAGKIDVSDNGTKKTVVEAVTSGAKTVYNISPTADGGNVVNTVNGELVSAAHMKPTGALRMINTVAHNVRDIGGWECDGGHVRYGLIYRGGFLNEDDIPVLVDFLGIRHDVNLMGKAEAEATGVYDASPLGVINHVWDTYAYYDISDKVLIRSILETIFNAAKNRSPMYVHCTSGADRTGTICMLLEAMLGMSRSDIDKDYELTSFWTVNGENSWARTRITDYWQRVLTYLDDYVGLTFRDKVVSYVLSTGITIEEINEFRRNAIDGNPEDIPFSANTYTITNTLTRAVNTNTAAEVREYQPYIAEIKPYANCSLTSVSITMGGVDASGYYDNGTIIIPQVLGDIVITAVATQGEIVNLLTDASISINTRIRDSGYPTSANGYFVAEIPFDAYTANKCVIKNGLQHCGEVYGGTTRGNCMFAIVDKDKHRLGNWYLLNEKQAGWIKFNTVGNDLICNNIFEDCGNPVGASAAPDWSKAAYIRLGLALNQSTTAISSVVDVLNSGIEINLLYEEASE